MHNVYYNFLPSTPLSLSPSFCITRVKITCNNGGHTKLFISTSWTRESPDDGTRVRVSVREECQMHYHAARDNHRYLELVCASAFCPMKTRIGQKRGKGRVGARGTKRGAEERDQKRYRVCPPGYQEQRDARSQTYEEAIVREHFAPVTGARQWPPLTRPVTVSLFADNA